jgi:hypothetical protein
MPPLRHEPDDHLGTPYEEAFREHLWRMAGTGVFGDHVVAIDPWWRSQGQDQIDAVVLAQAGTGDPAPAISLPLQTVRCRASVRLSEVSRTASRGSVSVGA